jgi:Domain of unknown function (DUF4136)
MRITTLLTSTLLSLALVACSGVDIQHSAIDQFTTGNYRYYMWRTDPLPQETPSANAMHSQDSVIRRQVDSHLQSKGYILDPQRAQFTVHYRYVRGMVQGERSALASNIPAFPRAMPTRQVDQASVDNAIALGGVKETNNLIVQFNDRATNQAVWQVTLTEIVENANSSYTARLDDNLQRHLTRALRPLPQAPGT